MRWCFLVGFMGAGKTTLGARVATSLKVPFYDLDERIAEAAGMTIPQLFEHEGEGQFRERETRMLRQLIEAEPPGVVAAGGGAFTIEENRAAMSDAGVSVWLDVPFDTILARVEGTGRPLWQSEAEARALAEQRKKDYRLANHHLVIGTDSTDEAAAKLEDLLASYRNDS